jgi:peptidoglycan/LPS O-acetylase OafA/YrhL
LSSNEKIDICRGLFAFLVVVAHGLDLSWTIHPEVARLLPRWQHDLLLYVPAAGVYWVIGFFVISGYCIQLSVQRQIEGNTFSPQHYMVARMSRILPLYYPALILAVVVERLVASYRPVCWPHGVNFPTFLAQLFVVQNFSQTYGSFAPSWSITNEVFYYALYGTVVCLTLKRGIQPARLGISLCLVLALLLDWLYFFGCRSPYVRSPGLLFGLGIIWFQGALVAEQRTVIRDSKAFHFLSGIWPLVLILAMVMWWSQGVHLQVVYLTLGGAFTLMLAQFVVNENPGQNGTLEQTPKPLIHVLGLASYPTYVFHGPILIFAGAVVMRWHLLRDWRVTWMVLSGVGIGSGLLLGYLVERPLMSWRARYLKRLRQSWLVPVTGDVSAPALGVQR